MLNKRVKTGVMPHDCLPLSGYSDCDGIQRWHANPYDAEVDGVYNYAWLCEGVYRVLEEDI